MRETPSARALGYQQITDLSAAVGLTVPAGTVYAIIIPESQSIRYRDDGTSPTAGVGMPLSAGTIITYTAGQLSVIKFIEQAAGAKLNISYYG